MFHSNLLQLMTVAILFALTTSFQEIHLRTEIKSNTQDIQTIQIPILDYRNIYSIDRLFPKNLGDSLINFGIIQINNIPSYKDARIQALGSLNDCYHQNKHDFVSSTLSDGSERFTIGTKSEKNAISEFSNKCVASSANSLQKIIKDVIFNVFKSLDEMSESETDVMTPYRSYSDLIQNGDHLEHLHIYNPSSNTNIDSNIPTIDMHTDNGLFIAMTAGYYQGLEPSSSSGLYIEYRGSIYQVNNMIEDALIIMVGEGGEKWINSKLSSPLRAVPHALLSGLRGDTTRTWYGKMFLPPQNALIPLGNEYTHGQSKVTYAEYRKMELKTSRESYVYKDKLPLACDGSKDSYLGIFGGGLNCLTNEIYCWMGCMSTDSVGTCPAGASIECVNPANNEITPPEQMCPDCKPMCFVPPKDNSTTLEYCYGTGVSMSMTGFVTTALSQEGSSPCFNLLFTTWTLNSAAKLAVACIGVFLLGLSVPLVGFIRSRVDENKNIYEIFDSIVNRITSIPMSQRSIRNIALKLFLYGLQITAAYMLMLIAMTYSAELFSMVIVGLVVGFAIFNVKSGDKFKDVKPSEVTTYSYLESNLEEHIDPCCNDGT